MHKYLIQTCGRDTAIQANTSSEAVKLALGNFGSKIYDVKTTLLNGDRKSIKNYKHTVSMSSMIKYNKSKLDKPTSTIFINDLNRINKYLKESNITFFHGTKDSRMIPSFNYMNVNNDYGKGLYTTPDIELAKEWSYASYTKGNSGYVYTYSLNIKDLKILNFLEYDSIYWLAELLTNRELNIGDEHFALSDRLAIFLEKYKLYTLPYDIIVGYRADDSYFSYAEDFLNGTIYKHNLDNALKLGNLGVQIFIKSKEAFKKIKFINLEQVNISYRQKFINRDRLARDEYRRFRKTIRKNKNGKTIFDYI